MKIIDHLNLLELTKRPLIKYLPPAPIKDRIKKWLRKIFLFLFFSGLLIGGAIFIYHQIYSNRIYPGVYLGPFQLGSLRRGEAKNLLEPFIDEVELRGIHIVGQSEKGQKEIYIKPILIAVTDPDLSRRIISLDLEATLDRAMAVGRSGSIIDQLTQIAASQLRGWPIEAAAQIDQVELEENIKFAFKSLEQEANDAGFEVVKTGEIKLIEDQPGYSFDTNKAAEEIKRNLLAIDNKTINLQLRQYEPKIKIQDVELISDRIRKTLDLAPVTLKSAEKKWSIKKSLLGQWLSLQKNKDVELILDQEKVGAYLSSLSKDINQEALDAKFKMSGDRVIEFQPSRAGQKLQIEASIQEITKQILANNREIDLVVEAAEPEVLTQDVNDLGIKELIGRGISNFAGSPRNRRLNIAVGAKKLHGILIKPGEEFSLVKAIGEVNEQAGFLPELVIKGGRTIPEFGGGLCQIGTTAFRVALYSGLPITARTPHSYRVVYYEPAGMDATIYQPQPDFKFINNTGYHILFQTKIEGDSLIFEFYGTSDGRKTEITQPKLFNITQPGPPVYIETTELPVGKKKKVESQHPGADAEFTRAIIYPDGKKKEEVWKSHYRPWQEIWLVGVEQKEETPQPITP